MGSRTYESFDLLVETLDPVPASAAARFRARVTSSPVGEGASSTFSLPFDPTTLENLLLKLDPGRSQMRRAAADPRPRAAMELGGGLFDAVFDDEILLAWSRSQDATGAAGEGLRLRLQLTDAPQIAGLPWELLFDRRTNSFVAQSERTPLVRYLEVPDPPRPLTVEGPLRVLVVVSSPTDLPELDVEGEWQRLQERLSARVTAGTVHLDRLPAPTTDALAAWLRTHDVNVLHVIGHGDYDAEQQQGVLYLCDAYGRSVPVSAAVLGPYLHDHGPLRLVFLNACQSARIGTQDPFSGMAQRLVQQDCTAVVAMQFPISDGAALTFTSEFYACLADGLPVDQATTSARKALLAGYASEWATPVLFLRSPDGQVFDAITAGPVSAASPTPSPAPVPAAGQLGVPGRGRLVAVAAAVAVLAAVGIGYAVTRGSGTPSQSGTSSVAAGPSGGASTPVAAQPAPQSAIQPTLPSATGDRSAAGLVPLQGPAMTAARLTSPPTIDGKPDDWPVLTPVIADYPVVGSTASVKGVWNLGWDAEHLYLFVQVVDPEVSVANADDPARVFEGDGVTLQFGPNGAPSDKISLSTSDVSLSTGFRADGTTVSALTAASGSTFDADAGRAITTVQAATQRTSTGYSLEVSAPWSTVERPDFPGLSTPYAGAAFGANLVVNDADPAAGNATGIRSRVSNNRYASDHATSDGSYRPYWGVLTLG